VSDGTENPTLKIRLSVPGHPLGYSCCHQYAQEALLGAPDGVTVLDAKWGRKPQVWHDTGRDWGRQRLTAEERGYVTAVADLAGQTAVSEQRLVAIIRRLVSDTLPPEAGS
jgi:hypothetical protein